MQPMNATIKSNSVIHFFSPSQLARSALYHVISIGEFYCNDSYRIERLEKKYVQNNYLIIETIDGEGQCFYDGNDYVVKARDILMINCNKIHQYSSVNNWHFRWMHFNGPAVSEIYNQYYQHFGCLINDRQLKIRDYLGALLERDHQADRQSETHMSALLHDLLCDMVTQIPVTNTSEVVADTYVNQALMYIEKHLHEHISLNQIASSINLSISQFSRIFKIATGYSPYKYITYKRIARAKFLLQTTNLTIKKIAAEVGFQSEPHFIELFQGMIGITPTEYRRLQTRI